MPKKSVNWLKQEEQMLKQLKNEQITNNKKDWKMIAKVLNQKFLTNKNPKQCRERYINHLKFANNVETGCEWEQAQLNILFQHYLNYGSSWATISCFFQNKSENSIKNKFNNCMKVAAKKIKQCKQNFKQPLRKKITSQLLNIVLDLSNQIRKLASNLKMTINQDSMIFKFQRNILKLCLVNHTMEEFIINQTITLLRSINSKLKCFGLFKVNNRKQWKLSSKNLYKICQLDKVLNEQFIWDPLKDNIQVKIKELTPSQNSFNTLSQSFDLPQAAKFQNHTTKKPDPQLGQNIPLFTQFIDHPILDIIQGDEYLFDF